jgi:MFS family permease
MPEPAKAAEVAPRTSPWSPLRNRFYRSLWIAAVASNIGTWMHEVGASWLMTSLTSAPAWVAAVQAATSLPLFLLAVPSGVWADLFDRRRLLLLAQFWMLVAALTLGILALAHQVAPWSLLALTFALGLGAALSGPAWQAALPEVVPIAELPSAIALNSLGFNIARAFGPALGGVAIALAGPGAAFLANAVSFLAVVFVLLRWRRAPSQSQLPGEHFWSALRSGLRYVSFSPRMRTVLVRSAVFIVCASALWALLPLVVRFGLRRGPGGYGTLVACFGCGAVLGAANLQRARRLGMDRLAVGCTVIFAGALLVMAWSDQFMLVAAALFLAGGSWLTVLSSFNVSAQTALPAWVRARGLGVYLVAFYAAMTAGSTLWGAVATASEVRVALTAAAVCLLLGTAVVPYFRLRDIRGFDLSPSRHWPAPLLPVEPEPERGTVLVRVEYRIDPLRAREFRVAMRTLRRSRRRGGAIRWSLWVDAKDPGRYVESFVEETWLEHLRHHERVTALDRDIEARVLAFHLGSDPPAMEHWLSAEED